MLPEICELFVPFPASLAIVPVLPFGDAKITLFVYVIATICTAVFYGSCLITRTADAPSVGPWLDSLKLKLVNVLFWNRISQHLCEVSVFQCALNVVRYRTSSCSST